MADPMWVEVLPDEGVRRRTFGVMWPGVMHFCRVYGEVFTTPQGQGAACWAAPGKMRVTFWRMLRAGSGLMWTVMQLSKADRKRFFKVMQPLDRLHRRLMPGQHWYLWAFGVEPASQGQGIGGALLAPILARADAERVPCYLETETEENVAFYRRRGFEVAEEARFLEGRVTIWAMRRDPQKGPEAA